MSAAVKTVRKVWTEEELQALPADEYAYELVHGQLVMSPKNNFLHGDICGRLLAAMANFVNLHRMGVVVDSSTGFWMANRNCRAPDISFISKTRLKGLTRPPSAFFRGAPDLAVELMAPSDSPKEIMERLEDFFSSGTRLAWIIHPDEEFVGVCHSPTQRRIIASGGVLDGEDVSPGFQFPVADLFRPWDWT